MEDRIAVPSPPPVGLDLILMLWPDLCFATKAEEMLPFFFFKRDVCLVKLYIINWNMKII